MNLMHPGLWTWQWAFVSIAVLFLALMARKAIRGQKRKRQNAPTAVLPRVAAPVTAPMGTAATVPDPAATAAAVNVVETKISKLLNWSAFAFLLMGIAASVWFGHRNLQKENLILRDLRHQNLAIENLKTMVPPPAPVKAASPAPKPDKCVRCTAQTETEDGVALLLAMHGDWAFFEGKCIGEDFCSECQPAAPKRDQHPTPSCHKRPPASVDPESN